MHLVELLLRAVEASPVEAVGTLLDVSVRVPTAVPQTPAAEPTPAVRTSDREAAVEVQHRCSTPFPWTVQREDVLDDVQAMTMHSCVPAIQSRELIS